MGHMNSERDLYYNIYGILEFDSSAIQIQQTIDYLTYDYLLGKTIIKFITQKVDKYI